MKITVRELFQVFAHLCTKRDLKETEDRIMGKLEEHVGRQNARIDRLIAAVSGLEGDVAFLKAKIAQLESTLGDDITPEQEALFAAVEERFEGAVAAAEAADALTPKVPPTEPA